MNRLFIFLVNFVISVCFSPVLFAQSGCFSVSEVSDIKNRLAKTPELFLQQDSRLPYWNTTSQSLLLQLKKQPITNIISRSTDFSGSKKRTDGSRLEFLNKLPESICISEIEFQVPEYYSKQCDDYAEPPLSLLFRKNNQKTEYEITSTFNSIACVAKQIKKTKTPFKDAYLLNYFFDEMAGLSSYAEKSYLQHPFLFSTGSNEPLVGIAQNSIIHYKLPVQGSMRYATFYDGFVNRPGSLVWLTEEKTPTGSFLHAYLLRWINNIHTVESLENQKLEVAWKYDMQKKCANADIHFVANGLRITNFQRKNGYEIWLKTRAKCPEDKRWQSHIVMYDGKNTYQMSGTANFPENNLLPIYGNDDYQFDQAFLSTSENIRQFALKLWKIGD